MDYTQSPDAVTHGGTGHKMHSLAGAVTTEVTDKDLNSVIWSLMAILNAAGVAGVQFDPAVPGSYDRVLFALKQLFPRFNGDGTVSLGVDAIAGVDVPRLSQVQALIAASGGAPIGFPGHWPGATPPSGWIKRNGTLLPRSGAGSYPLLTALVLSGNVKVVSEAAWPSNPGAFTLGDGATTIRIPDGRGLTDKGYHDGSGTFTTDTTRALGSYGADGNKAHTHGAAPYGFLTGAGGIFFGGTGGNMGSASNTDSSGNAETTVRDAVYLPIIRAY